MNSEPRFTGISVLIPGYSVEDIPTDLNDQKATGLLNAIACAWHPAVIAAADEVPQFRYADISEIVDSRQILILPECSEEWLGHDWQTQLEEGNCHLLHSLTNRSEWLDAIAIQFRCGEELIDRALVDHFLALGLAWYLVMALSRRMHYYIDPDEARLSSAVRDAAEAASLGRLEDARQALNNCFECLLETREQLFPAAGYLLDICLPPAPGNEHQLLDLAECGQSVNLLSSGAELNALQQNHTEVHEKITAAAASGSCCIVNGGWHELRTSLSCLSDAYSDLHRTITAETRCSNVWGQRRFGLLHSLPGLLRLFEYDFAVHVALDDGLYPEREYDAFQWNDAGSATIAASSRLPIAIDSSASFLRLPERLAESMQQDATAVLMLARLPATTTPWLHDLRRIHEFCPLLGRFVTFTELHQQLDQPGETVRFRAGEYLGPYLIQASVLNTEAAVTGPADLYRCRNDLERLASVHCLNEILTPETTGSNQLSQLEFELQDEQNQRLITDTQGDMDAQKAEIDRLNERIGEQLSEQIRQFARLLPRGTATGSLVINALAFARETTICWPADRELPRSSSNILTVYRQQDRVFVRTKLPPGGYVQLTAAGPGQPRISFSEPAGRPLAEEGLLRNEHFEAILSSSTGGIADVRFHGQRANRVSQQVAFRYENPKTVPETEESEEYTTSYAQTHCDRMQVIDEGPWTGAIESHCLIRDVLNDEVLFRFRQITRVERTVPRISIQIIPNSTDLHRVSGNPWMTYLACRFAWDNEAASITRSLLGQACGFQGERFESPDYVEIADEDHQLLIVPHGRPYHRRSGRRMLDSVLLVEGQAVPADGFEFTLEFDQPFPQRTVKDVLQPPLVERVKDIESSSGWILACSARNVQIARVRPCDGALVVVLQETEGRPATCRLRTARAPESACTRRATGTVIRSLDVDNHGVTLNFESFELKEVQLTF